MVASVNVFLVRLWLFVSAVFFTVLAGAAMADIENTATVNATYGNQALVSLPSAQSVPVVGGAPRIILTKVIDRVEDTNDNGVTDAGDTVFYTFEIYNAGNLTLEQVEVEDPPVAIVPTSVVGPLAPGGRDTTLSASYVLKLEDLNAGGYENSAKATAALPNLEDGTTRDPIFDISDAGDENVETADLAGLVDDDPTNDPTVLLIEGVRELSLAKSFVGAENVYPYIYDVTYRFELTNNGTVTAQNLQLRDDLFGQFANAQIISTEVIETSGFDGDSGDNSGANIAFDGNQAGAGSAQLLADDVALSPNGTGVVVIVTRLEFAPETFIEGPLVLENQAVVTAEGFLSDFESYDPDSDQGGTPTPTVTKLLDTDGDGASDGDESTTADRDGDGIANAYDYDPTGYFYCEETGEILSGGNISIVDAFGSSDNIRMIADGTSGYFQWFATQPGVYTMSYNLPPNSAPSAARPIISEPLILASLTENPTSIGSSEFGDTGTLADFTFDANPYYETLVIDENDPHVLNINIPVRFCSTPVLAATKTVSSDPVVQADGRSALSYEMTLANTGSSRADDVNLVDNLNEVFGAGRFEFVSVDLTAAPDNFAGNINNGFDGASDTNLLNGRGNLNPEDRLTVSLSLLVDPERTGTYTNTVTGTGVLPLNGDAITPATAEVDVELTVAVPNEALLITKSVNPSRARVGDVVTFTITVENTADTDFAGLTLVDSLPQGLAYRPNAGTLRGVADEPAVTGRTLRWSGLQLGAGETVVATLQTTLTSRAEVGTMTNQAWVASGVTGARVTMIAEATVELIAEAIFNCSDVIGSVFDDRNMNGFQDGAPDIRALITNQTYVGDKADKAPIPMPEGAEEGIANARLVTPTGTVITTDDFGRYSVPCAELPRRAGSNFTLKLDTRSLPSGYRVVTENPRTMRVTPGIFTEMNFGAATGRVIEIDLTAAAFTARNEPSKALAAGLEQLLRRAANTPSVVRINYYRDAEGSDVARDRLDATEDLIHDLWNGIGDYELIIERSVARFE